MLYLLTALACLCLSTIIYAVSFISKKSSPLFVILPLLILNFLSTEVFAQDSEDQKLERIISFHSDIRIDSSGLMKVSEKIKVYAYNLRINRGITRTIPLYRKDVFGRKKLMDFKITSILKDGKKEHYKTESPRTGRTIYIGNEDVIIPPGTYEYEINYESKGHVGFFNNFDEIYWNVTGSQWGFPIEHASATITLPKGAMPSNMSCYTGPPGSKAKNCDITLNPDHSVTFRTTETLSSGEGFTVASAFTKGIIKRPSFFENFLSDFIKMAITIALLIALAVIYYKSWLSCGPYPEKRAVIPTFNIPNDWSPAMVRYFYKKKIDEKSFPISVINMAVKKVVKISKGIGKKEDYAVERATEYTTVLSTEENAIYTRWLNKKKRIYINKANGPAINAAKNAHEKVLKPQLDFKEFYISYKKPLTRIIIITAIAVVIFTIFVESGTPLILLFFSPFILIGTFCFISGLKIITENIFIGLFLLAFGTGFGGGPLWILIMEFKHIPIISIVFILTVTAMLVVYLILIKAPTDSGMETINKIKGFKMYLKTAEEHRLNMLNPPALSPALFEKFLPYAIALDVENEWGKKFQQILTDANYNPEWYEGDDFSYIGFAYVFIQPFNSAVSDSVPDTSSSSSSGSSSWDSGSSDSGSSDGGGGGGGGDGW